MKKMKKSALAAAVLLSVTMMNSVYASEITKDVKDITEDIVVAAGDTLTLTDTTNIGELDYAISGAGKTILNCDIKVPKGISTQLVLNSGAKVYMGTVDNPMKKDLIISVVDGQNAITLANDSTDTQLVMNVDGKISINALGSGNGRGITSAYTPVCLVDLAANEIEIIGGNGSNARGLTLFDNEGHVADNVLKINQDSHQDGIVNISGGVSGLRVRYFTAYMDGGKINIKGTYTGGDGDGLDLDNGAVAYIGQNNTNGIITIEGQSRGIKLESNNVLYMDGKEINVKGEKVNGISLSYGQTYIGQKNIHGEITFAGNGTNDNAGISIFQDSVMYIDGDNITSTGTKHFGINLAQNTAALYVNQKNITGKVTAKGGNTGVKVSGKMYLDGKKIDLISTGTGGYGLNVAATGKVYIGEKNPDADITIVGQTHAINMAAGAAVSMIAKSVSLSKTEPTQQSDLGDGLGTVVNAGILKIAGGTNGMTWKSGTISGDGTTEIKGKVRMLTGTISNTLTGNGATLQQAGDGEFTTLVVDKLDKAANLNLAIDVDMSKETPTSDKVTVGSVVGETGTPTLNLSAINITKDINPVKEGVVSAPDMASGTDAIVYADGDAVTGGSVNCTVGGTDAKVVATNNYTYTFTAGTTNGALNYVVTADKNTLKKFIAGDITGATTLSLTGDLAYSDTGSVDQENNELTINTNGKNITTTGSGLIVNIGSGKTLNVANTVDAVSGVNANFNVDGTLNLSGKLNVTGDLDGQGTINNSGTLDIPWANLKSKVVNTGTVNVTGGGELSGQSVDGTGTVKLYGDYTVDCATLSGAALTAATVSVDDDSTLTLNNAKKNTTVQIIDGTATGGWADAEAKQYTADETPEGLNVGDKVKLFTINKDGGFAITINKAGASFVDPSGSAEDGIPTSIVDVATLMSDSEDEKVQKFMDALSDIEDAQGPAAASNAVETVANMSAVAGVQSGTASMVNSMANNLSSNLGSSARPNLMSGSKGGLRNTANDNGEVKIDTVEVGKAADVMPERYLAKAYNKEVWASYIHSKQRVDGLKAGMLSNQSTMQYNGVTVGADLWSGKHSFGGVALSYADGNTNAGNLRNDTDYYGVSIYNRHDYKGLIMLTDVSYTHSKNDINISGVQEITADAKADAIGVGVRFETPVTMGKTTVTPYAGARYTYLKNKDYDNNLGMNYDTDDQNLVTIPVGLEISAEFAMPKSDWTFRPVLEGGYVWNLGDRDGNTKIGYMGAYDIVGFETSDPGQYFIRAAMQFAKADFTCEVGYRYSKGKSVRDNRWNVNLNYAF